MAYELLPQIKTQAHDDSSFHAAASPIHLPPPEFLHEAIFAAGSFWGLEASFGRVDGVVRTAAGYFGGTIVKPSYREVSEGNTGHTEAVKVTYDRRKTSFRSLCKVFWESHDPTDKNYLMFGVTTHYQSAIFHGNEEEKKQARQSKVQKQMKLNRRIVTKIIPCPSTGFYMAESHHQKYNLQRHYIRLCECLSLRSTEHFADSHLACKLNGILGGDEKNAVEDLKTFMKRYELPNQSKIVLEGVIRELREKNSLEG